MRWELSPNRCLRWRAAWAGWLTFAKEWRITVFDEGGGVLPSELDAIFEPFFRGKSGGSHAGYGLGLAITQRVVQAHGGTVSAANRPC
jgi:signal transduction histidine kinase